MNLNEGQELAKSQILDFLGSNERFFILTGVAGTGKTYLINQIKSEYTRNKKNKLKWFFTATTNKAAEVLSVSSSSEASTVHKFMKLGFKTNYGTGVMILDTKRAVTIRNSIVVIDEASYIDDILLEVILRYMDSSTKVIFMGDPLQLTPVSSSEVPVFNKPYPSAVLDEVMRQDKGSEIQLYCERLRHYIKHGGSFPSIKKGGEIEVYGSYIEFMVDVMADVENPNKNTKVISYTNKTVQHYNKKIFELTDNRKVFVEGDYVINNRYVEGLGTDVETYITDIREATVYDVRGYHVRVGDSKKRYFMPENVKDYENAKNKAIADNMTGRVKDIVTGWVDLRHVFSCTVNKSQGSTYDTVFIDMDDLLICKDKKMLARLLYVAISRAKYKVSILKSI